MLQQIKESDWKILRELHKVALERFCQQVLVELERTYSDHAESFHQKYLDIYQLIKRRDSEIAEIFNDLRRSTAFIHLSAMKARGLLTEDEFLRLSEETRDIVALILGD